MLMFILFPKILWADVVIDDSFYIGIDPSKNDRTIGKIDNSQEKQDPKDKYYGYKISNGGFFISPEVFSKDNKINASLLDSNSVDYNVKANVGYDFSRYFSAFLTYDLLNFSYNINQNSATIITNNNLASQLGLGSQFNISDDFGIKFSYSQKFEESITSNAQIKTEMLSVGTVYSF